MSMFFPQPHQSFFHTHQRQWGPKTEHRRAARALLIVGLLLFLPNCSKRVAVCMTMEQDGHANGTVTAGPFGDVLDLNIHGPGTMQRIPEDMPYNPCVVPKPQSTGGPIT